MENECVRIWRPPDEERALLIAGTTTRYSVDPRIEYVFGTITAAVMRARRGRERWLVGPGQLLAWDPSQAHSGSAFQAEAWSARLLIVDSDALGAILADEEIGLATDPLFPDPILDEPGLTDGFLRLHTAMEGASTRLERDERLAEWLRDLVLRCSAKPAPRSPLTLGDRRGLKLARDYLGDHLDRNIGLDELAAAAGVGKFRLIRLFRERIGLPPHALQLAHRIRRARRLLEAGETIASTAAATGFADQSHMHRHFRRSLGMTPGEYRRWLAG